MRERQRNERGESAVKRALTDLQFIAELGVLTQAHDHPTLVDHRDTGQQLRALAEIGWLSAASSQELVELFDSLLRQRHHDWLSRTSAPADIEHWQATIEPTWTDRFGDRSDRAN